MANTDSLYKMLSNDPATASNELICLVPNAYGLKKAIEANVNHIAVFTATSDQFSIKNTGLSVKKSIKEMIKNKGPVTKIRGHVSCIFHCPYEGEISPKTVSLMADELLSAGCYEVSLGDTTGTGTVGTKRI